MLSDRKPYSEQHTPMSKEEKEAYARQVFSKLGISSLSKPTPENSGSATNGPAITHFGPATHFGPDTPSVFVPSSGFTASGIFSRDKLPPLRFNSGEKVQIDSNRKKIHDLFAAERAAPIVTTTSCFPSKLFEPNFKAKDWLAGSVYRLLDDPAVKQLAVAIYVGTKFTEASSDYASIKQFSDGWSHASKDDKCAAVLAVAKLASEFSLDTEFLRSCVSLSKVYASKLQQLTAEQKIDDLIGCEKLPKDIDIPSTLERLMKIAPSSANSYLCPLLILEALHQVQRNLHSVDKLGIAIKPEWQQQATAILQAQPKRA